MLTVDEVAMKYRVSKRTIFRWKKKGLRTSQHGRVLRFHVDDVDAFLRSNTSTSGATPPSTAVPPSATP